MEHYASSGGQMKRSSCGSHLDFVNYWADKTVEEAVLRGQQLRQIKTLSLAQEQNDVNIDVIKPPVIVKENVRRKTSSKTSNKKHKLGCLCIRDKSPARSVLQQKQKKDKGQKPKAKVPCGMRTAELAMPSKRQCLETWKNKCDTLPAFMIERLRKYVMDQSPVIPISDAIYCFKRKCKRRKRTENTGDKTNENNIKKLKKPLRGNDIKVLCAIFGHKIANKLNPPLKIILNSDLEKLANVVFYDIAEMMYIYKNFEKNVNDSMHREVTEKVTIWVSDVLDETTYKILEDQLKDFEEEAGPALDVVEDLVDNVLDVCVPQPVFEELSPHESSASSFGLEEEILEPHASSEKVGVDNTHVDEKIEDYLLNAVHGIINEIDKDDTKSGEYQDVDEGPEWVSSEDIEARDADVVNNDNLEFKGGASEKSYNEEAKDADVIEGKYVDPEYDNAQSDNVETKDADVNEGEYVETENDNTAGELFENDEVNNRNDQNDTYLEPEDDVALESREDAEVKDVPQNEIGQADDTGIMESSTDTAEANPPNEEIDGTDKISENSDEHNKKVKFNEMENAEKTSELKDLDWKASIERIDFAGPNEDLLSEADESWPEEIQPPVVRPSQSVSKSITSLGKINEDDEKASVRPEEIAKTTDTEAQDKSDTLEIGEKLKPSTKDSKKKDNKAKDSSAKKKTNTDGSVKSKEKRVKKERGKAIKESEKNQPRQEQKEQNQTNQREAKTLNLETKNGKSKEVKPSHIAKLNKPSISSKRETSPDFKNTKIKNKIKERTFTSKRASQDIQSAKISQSSKDLGDLNIVIEEENDKNPSVSEKAKPNYRVNVETAPAWINRRFGEPSCSCILVNVPKSKVKIGRNENELRKWCQDLERGYQNLKLWNDWIDNTSRTVCILQKEINCLENSTKCTNKDWLKLKRHIDKDAYLWRRLNQNTREKLRCCKKLYQKRSETPSNYKIECCKQDSRV